jgi:hypothetical protein
MNFKLGRNRPPHRAKLMLKKYCPDPSVLPTAPATCSWVAKAATALALIYMNSTLGCCVIAGGYHDVGVWTGNATGTPFCATDAQIIADYGAIGGYVQGDPSTDQGCNEQTALQYWCTTGFADGSKLGGYVGVDATNQQEVMSAVYLFETVFLGIELPDAWISTFPVASGFVWDVEGDANPQNGHCVVVVGYDETGVQIATWGLIGTITWAALAKYCSPTSGGEIYALLSPDEVSGTDAPNGFDYATLQTDLAALSTIARLAAAIETA